MSAHTLSILNDPIEMAEGSSEYSSKRSFRSWREYSMSAFKFLFSAVVTITFSTSQATYGVEDQQSCEEQKSQRLKTQASVLSPLPNESSLRDPLLPPLPHSEFHRDIVGESRIPIDPVESRPEHSGWKLFMRSCGASLDSSLDSCCHTMWCDYTVRAEDGSWKVPWALLTWGVIMEAGVLLFEKCILNNDCQAL